MATIKIQKPFHQSIRVKLDTGEGLTEQSHKNQTDMNYILKDYAKTGLMKHVKENEGRYDDIDVQDFQEAMFIVTNANNMFEQLPSLIRKRFQNNPIEFMEFVHNPANKAEMQKMGILQGNDGLDAGGNLSNAPIKDPVIPEPSATGEPDPTAPEGAV